MNSSFGPWSTAISAVNRNDLSAFWKSRMSKLPSLPRTPGLVTRRELLRLGAAAVVGCAMPTLRGAAGPAAAAEKAGFKGKIVLFGVRPANKETHLIQTLSPDGAEVETIAEYNDESVVTGRVSPDGGRLAFTIDRNPKMSLWLMSAATRERTMLVEDAVVGCWSPDGKRIAFYRGGEGRWQNFSVDVDTKQVEPLPLPPGDTVWDWSPDGSELLSISHRDGGVSDEPGLGRWSLRQIYRTKVDGGAVRLTDPAADHLWPRFSPDGRKIALESRVVADGKAHLLGIVVDREGKNRVEVTRFDRRSPRMAPCWSPGGDELAWLCYRIQKEAGADTGGSAVDFHIVVMKADGSAERQITSAGSTWINDIDWR